jgi:hypothetical protein
VAGHPIQPRSLANQLAAFCPALLSQSGFYGLVLDPQFVAIFLVAVSNKKRLGSDAIEVESQPHGSLSRSAHGRTLPSDR